MGGQKAEVCVRMPANWSADGYKPVSIAKLAILRIRCVLGLFFRVWSLLGATEFRVTGGKGLPQLDAPNL